MIIAFIIFLVLTIYAIYEEIYDKRIKDIKLDIKDTKLKIIRKLQKNINIPRVYWRKYLISSMISLILIKYFIGLSLTNREFLMIIVSIFVSFYVISSFVSTDDYINELLIALKKAD